MQRIRGALDDYAQITGLRLVHKDASSFRDRPLLGFSMLLALIAAALFALGDDVQSSGRVATRKNTAIETILFISLHTITSIALTSYIVVTSLFYDATWAQIAHSLSPNASDYKTKLSASNPKTFIIYLFMFAIAGSIFAAYNQRGKVTLTAWACLSIAILIIIFIFAEQSNTTRLRNRRYATIASLTAANDFADLSIQSNIAESITRNSRNIKHITSFNDLIAPKSISSSAATSSSSSATSSSSSSKSSSSSTA